MELVDIQRVTAEAVESHRAFLKTMIRNHVNETGSEWAHEIISNFADYASRFWLVKPKAASLNGLLAQAHANPQ
jgi:glutamate synthase (NADPH/NADH) large chain